MQYVSQKDSKYADCLPRAMVNACRFYGLPCPDPDSPAWEEVVDFAGCRHGTSVATAEKLAEFFGLRAVKVASSDVATTVNYRIDEGPLVERLPVELEEQPPQTAFALDDDATIPNRALHWEAMYLAKAPNDRCYILEPA